MTIYEVVTTLIGPIYPAGDASCDDNRFENLKAMTELVTQLVNDIDDVTVERNRDAYSLKRAGEFAHKYLTKDLGIEE